MAVSKTERWKIPIAYFLINEVSTSLKTEIIKITIEKLMDAGANVESITCDGLISNKKMLENLGAELNVHDAKPWFNHFKGNPKNVHIIHNSEHPASVFSLLDNGTKMIPLVADGLFDLLMIKMTPVYTSKKQTKIESKGPRFELGDFLIKLGSVTMSENFKGVLVEVEYRPCVIPSMCWELIREFLQGFLGSSVPNQIPMYFTTPSSMNPNHNKLNEIYQPLDTVQQYLEHFMNYRKQSSVQTVGGMRN